MEMDKKKLLLIGGSVFFLVVLLTNIILRSKISIYKSLYARSMEDLNTMKILAKEAEELGGFYEEGFLPPDVSLFSYIEEVARNSDIVLESITPLSTEEKGSVRSISVSISAKDISPDLLVRFLYGLEYDSPYILKIERCQIKTSFRDRTKLDLKTDISGIQKK